MDNLNLHPWGIFWFVKKMVLDLAHQILKYPNILTFGLGYFSTRPNPGKGMSAESLCDDGYVVL